MAVAGAVAVCVGVASCVGNGTGDGMTLAVGEGVIVGVVVDVGASVGTSVRVGVTVGCDAGVGGITTITVGTASIAVPVSGSTTVTEIHPRCPFGKVMKYQRPKSFSVTAIGINSVPAAKRSIT